MSTYTVQSDNLYTGPDNSAPDQWRYPLAPIQAGMLYNSLSQPGTGVDIQQLVCTLSEDLDVELFLTAWRDVSSRHQALRSCFSWDGIAEPVQVVQRSVVIPCVKGRSEERRVGKECRSR